MQLVLHDKVEARTFFGHHDEHLKLLERAFDVSIGARGQRLFIEGDRENQEEVVQVLRTLEERAVRGERIGKVEFEMAISHFVYEEDPVEALSKTSGDSVRLQKLSVNPRNPRQREYMELVRQNDLCFVTGPAGTGKTFLGVALACQALQRGQVQRLIMTRPAVEAGEKLGFLPGDLNEKINPYLRPLYDAMYEMLGPEKVLRFLDRGTIEVAPLAFMRGRTLNNAFIILDEAQNTTSEQMKMFLTRLGHNSKAVVTGDITQTDLPRSMTSGLKQAWDYLEGIEGIGFLEFERKDIVRHNLVQRIVDAYERFEPRQRLLPFSEEENHRHSNEHHSDPDQGNPGTEQVDVDLTD